MDNLSGLKNKQSSPFSASVGWDPEKEEKRERLNWLSQFVKLPRIVKYGLVNSETQRSILGLADSFQITDLGRVGEISRIVREVFTRKIREDEIKSRS